MFEWFKNLFTAGWRGRCPFCGSDRVKFKIRRKMPYVVDGPTVAHATCKICRHSWSFPIRVGI